MKRYIIPALLFLSLIGCKPKYEYWDISKFNLKPDALEDNEEIKLIYTSQGPDYNREYKYYIHLIAISQRTGDTVNILTTSDNGLNQNDGDKIFNYFGPDNPSTILSQMEVEEITSINHIDSLNKIKPKVITKVARDPKYDEIADNNFPTVIGAIGTVTSNAKQ